MGFRLTSSLDLAKTPSDDRIIRCNRMRSQLTSGKSLDLVPSHIADVLTHETSRVAKARPKQLCSDIRETLMSLMQAETSGFTILIKWKIINIWLTRRNIIIIIRISILSAQQIPNKKAPWAWTLSHMPWTPPTDQRFKLFHSFKTSMSRVIQHRHQMGRWSRRFGMPIARRPSKTNTTSLHTPEAQTPCHRNSCPSDGTWASKSSRNPKFLGSKSWIKIDSSSIWGTRGKTKWY